MSTISLAEIKRVYFWQRVVMLFWGIAWFRRLFNIYSYAHFLTNLFNEDYWFSFLVQMVSRGGQIILYVFILQQMWRLSQALTYYTENRTIHNFAVLIGYQQRIWTYLSISFGITALLSIYYMIDNLLQL
ncbi:MAG: hypothetical protein ACRBFS_12635 [Aureispira sp.]